MLSLHATYKRMDMKELEAWSTLGQDPFENMLHSGRICGYVMLKTCNRVEIYISSKSNADTAVEIAAVADKIGSKNYFLLEGLESARHLMEVSAGLDSMVIGDQEIQRQVKEALMAAQVSGDADSILNYVFMKALNAGKEVREKTRISSGTVSVSQVAVKLLEERSRGEMFGRICIIGTGRMGMSIAKYLSKYGRSVYLSGRSHDRLRRISAKLGINYIDLGDFSPERFDCIITATSSQSPIIKIGTIDKSPELVIDLGNPRNVDAAGNRGYVDLDSLKAFVSRNIRGRSMEIEKAKAIIDRKISRMSRHPYFEGGHVSRIELHSELAKH
jgi:glutamyl-tRNA reductase